MVSSWVNPMQSKNNFFIRTRKNKNEHRQKSVLDPKKRDKKNMNRTIRNSGYHENTNPSSIYYLDSNHSTFYKRYNCSNMNLTNPKVLLESHERILSNVINLSRDLENVHN